MARALPVGITKDAIGYRVFVWLNVKTPQHPKGRIASKRFPPGTPLADMVHWREAQRVDARRTPLAHSVNAVGFVADCARYLEAVAAMPTFAERVRQIRAWIIAFGDCDRLKDITPTRIRTQRDRWLTVGPKRIQAKEHGQTVWKDVPLPQSASSVNNRLHALENLFTVLDGRHAYNPVREVPEADPPDLEPRAIPRDVVAAILGAMPDIGKSEKGHRPVDSQTKARLSVMAYTGLSHSQLARVQPTDIDWTHGTLFMRPRHKGRGKTA